MQLPALPRSTLQDLRKLVVGTAGHVDQGKTELVKALTGIDCDRWAEEKARGITIDLGFAYLLDGDLQIGFVDVPGHQRFLHNALAGLGGIRAVLLVVAATEGIMPQTREHVAICSLLGIPAAVVAMTKVDLVSPDLVELAELEVEELLASTPYAGSPIVRVSSVTGVGVDRVRAALLALGDRHRVVGDPRAAARLPIDRAFHLRGLGTVVTGTLVDGTIRVGDALQLLPGGEAVRVRSLQVHGRPREHAEAGERTSLQLSGIELVQVARGMQLAAPWALRPSAVWACRLTLLASAPEPVIRPVPVRLHHFACEVMARLRPLAPQGLRPGETGVVELRLAAPVVGVRHDRFILRRPSPGCTLGGGEILDPGWRRPRAQRLAAAIAALQGETREALRYWSEAAGERGFVAEDLAWRLGRRLEAVREDLADLMARGELREVPDLQGQPRRWLASAVFAATRRRSQTVLAEYFRRDRLARGMPKAEAIKRILPRVSGNLARQYLAWLEQEAVLALDGDLVGLPGRSVQLAAAEAELAERLLARLEDAGLQPPPTDALGGELGAQPATLQAALRYLQDGGQLVRLPSGAVIAAAAIERLRQDLKQGLWKKFSVTEFKERFGLTRKWAIPLLEYLDSAGLTRRAGEQRIVMRGD